MNQALKIIKLFERFIGINERANPATSIEQAFDEFMEEFRYCGDEDSLMVIEEYQDRAIKDLKILGNPNRIEFMVDSKDLAGSGFSRNWSEVSYHTLCVTMYWNDMQTVMSRVKENGWRYDKLNKNWSSPRCEKEDYNGVCEYQFNIDGEYAVIIIRRNANDNRNSSRYRQPF